MNPLFSVPKKVFEILLFGLAAFLLVSFPIVFAFVAYALATHFGAHNREYWSLVTGLLSLLILPLWIAGSALRESLEHARKKQNARSNAVALPLAESLPSLWPFSVKDVLPAWQTSLEVQQHFNDLELQIRNFAVTLLVAVMGGTAFTLKEHYNIQLGDRPVSLAVVVLLAGILGWLAFYFMDRHWYHRLLIGSVRHTIRDIEGPYKHFRPLALSTRIGEESAIPIWKLDGPETGRTHWIEIHSSEKIDLFYSAGLFFFILLLAGTFLVPQPSLEPSNRPQPLARPQVQTPVRPQSR